MRKKVLALVLALVMVVAMLPTVAFAAEGNPANVSVSGVDGGGTKDSPWIVDSGEEFMNLLLKIKEVGFDDGPMVYIKLEGEIDTTQYEGAEYNQSDNTYQTISYMPVIFAAAQIELAENASLTVANYLLPYYGLRITGNGTIKTNANHNIAIWSYRNLQLVDCALDLDNDMIWLNYPNANPTGFDSVIKGSTVKSSHDVVIQVAHHCSLTLESGSITSTAEASSSIGSGGAVSVIPDTINSQFPEGSVGDGKFIMEGGTVTSNNCAVYVDNQKGSAETVGFTMKGGEIKSTSTQLPAVDLLKCNAAIEEGSITASNQALLVSQESTVNLSGGTIERTEVQDPAHAEAAVVVISGSKIEMTNGEIIGKEIGLQVQDDHSSATVTGGTIESKDADGAAAVAVTDGSTYKMTGGKIVSACQGLSVGNTADGGGEDGDASATIGGTAVIDCQEKSGIGEVQVGDSGTLTIEDGATINGSVAVFNEGKLEVTGGTITSKEGFAIGTNGSESKQAQITITGGTITGADTACGVYLPAGKLTMPEESSATIKGGAGIVQFGGTLEVKGGKIEATGTGTVEVGDSHVAVPAAAVTTNQQGGGYDDVKATIEGGEFTAPEGGTSVVYTEKGEIPDTKPEQSKLTVTGGKFETKDDNGETKPDYTVTNYIDNSHGVGSDGSVKEASTITDLVIVDFGYLPNAPEGIGPNKTVWISPKDIEYTVWKSASDKWGDATFYWAFNRALTSEEAGNGGIEVKFTCGEQTFTDTCNAQGIRFASSLKNSTQLGDDVVKNGGLTGGDYTISGTDFTVSKDIPATVHVTLPAADTEDAPIVTPATLSTDAQTTEGSVKAEITKADTTKQEYTVAVEAKNLHKHENSEGNMGYWVGFAVEVPEGGYTGFYYKFGEGEWQFNNGLEKISDAKNGVAFYFADTENTDVQLAWTKDSAKGEDPTQNVITFHVDFTGVEHYVAPVTPSTPTGGGTSTPSATVTTPASTNGSYTVSDKNAKAGDTVTITPKADEGYTVDTVTVTDKDGKDVTVTDNGDGTYSFVMPEKASQPVTVKVTFAKVAPSAKFVDVPQTAWYAEYVDYVVANGLMEGTSDTIFSPNMTTNRAMLVTILYRLEGEPAVTKDIPFSDVAAGEWYSDAINWAAANEIVNGYGDDTFRPLRELSREEAAAILYRYAEYKEYDVTATDDLAGYTDAETVSTWADTAMSWAVAEGIIKGTSETKLTPDGTAVRAQAAAMLTRFCENVAK